MSTWRACHASFGLLLTAKLHVEQPKKRAFLHTHYQFDLQKIESQSKEQKRICDKTELKFPSIIIRVEKPGGNLLCRELLVWCRSGPDQRSFVTPVTLSISPQCCGNTDDYLTLPKALTSNGGPFIVDQSLLDQQYNSSNIIRENKTLMVLVTLINGIHFGAQNRTGFPLVASKWKNSLLCWKISLFSTTEKYPFSQLQYFFATGLLSSNLNHNDIDKKQLLLDCKKHLEKTSDAMRCVFLKRCQAEMSDGCTFLCSMIKMMELP